MLIDDIHDLLAREATLDTFGDHEVFAAYCVLEEGKSEPRSSQGDSAWVHYRNKQSFGCYFCESGNHKYKKILDQI